MAKFVAATNPMSDRKTLMRSGLPRFPTWQWYARGQQCIWNPRRIPSWPPSNEMLECFVDLRTWWVSILRITWGRGVETGMSSEETAPPDHKKRAGSMDYSAEFFRGLNHEPVEDFGWWLYSRCPEVWTLMVGFEDADPTSKLGNLDPLDQLGSAPVELNWSN